MIDEAMRRVWRAAAASLAVVVGGCASVMTEEECAVADWGALGEIDGANGEIAERFDERASRCREFGFGVDADSYFAGRTAGLETYCLPETGFAEALDGRAYQGVCPPEAEPAFLEEYALGEELRIRQLAYDEAVADYERALEELRDNRYELRRARSRYEENVLSDEERAELRDNIRLYRREIERLEDDLPLLEVDIERASRLLDDYRGFLARIRG
ncbi:MAG: DUF2799 domain-containing protein [Pseudomonadota bacterium]